MADDAQDKKHLPTGKRLSDLRREGNVLRSKDLSGGTIFLTTVLLLIYMAGDIKIKIQESFFYSFSSIKSVLQDPHCLSNVITKVLINNIGQLLPIFIILFLITFLTPFLFGGWNFTLDVLQFKIHKLNPLNNIQKIFSFKNTLTEILKAMIKVSMFMGVLIAYFIANKNHIFDLTNQETNTAIQAGFLTVKDFIVYLCVALIFTTLFDMGTHYYKYLEQSKMSTQEVKDEHKDIEGNVESKRKMRGKQLALLKQRLMQSVPQADVILTNPTHYSVALRYNNTKDRAPKVVAKGKDLMAGQIRQIAIMNGINIYQAPELTRAIYFTTKIGHEIHPALYKAVAVVLSYVYQLKRYQMGAADLPQFVSEFEIPKEFVYRE